METKTKEISLQEAMTMAKTELYSTVDRVMSQYQLPPYLMEYIITDVLSNVRSYEISSMVSSVHTMKNKEASELDSNNSK